MYILAETKGEKMINSVYMTKLINEAKDAVDNSQFGSVFVYPDPQNLADKRVNQLNFTVFQMVFQAMVQDFLKNGNEVKV